MKVFNIGELIRHRRIECGYTQEQLCHGICEPPTMSRIESGYTTPSRSKLTALLQRLGMSGEKYYALLSENELEAANLQSEITSCIVRRDSLTGLSKVKQLEQLMEKDDHILKQYTIKSRVALGKEINGQIVAYSFDERLEMLYQAIRMTVPSFTIDSINKFILSVDEIQIINQIATTYAHEDNHIEEIKIYSKLMKYIEDHQKTLNPSSGSSPVSILISYNFARALYLNGQYLEAIDIANISLEHSISLRNSSYLGSILFVKAHSLFCLHNIEASRSTFLQSYYVYKATNDHESSSYVRGMIKQLFLLSIED